MSEIDTEDLARQIADLEQAFKLKGIKADSELERAIETASIIVEGDAANLAPVDTGLLRNSINHRVEKHGSEVVGIVGTAIEYAAVQEFGSSKQQKQPFLGPALRMNRTVIKNIITKAIGGAMK